MTRIVARFVFAALSLVSGVAAGEAPERIVFATD